MTDRILKDANGMKYINNEQGIKPDSPAEILLRLYSCKSDLAGDAAAEIVRLRQALRWQQDREGRIGTHGPDCWKFGHNHYECALRKIEQIKSTVENWGEHD